MYLKKIDPQNFALHLTDEEVLLLKAMCKYNRAIPAVMEAPPWGPPHAYVASFLTRLGIEIENPKESPMTEKSEKYDVGRSADREELIISIYNGIHYPRTKILSNGRTEFRLPSIEGLDLAARILLVIGKKPRDLKPVYRHHKEAIYGKS